MLRRGEVLTDLRLLPERHEGRHVLQPFPPDAIARGLRRRCPPYLVVAQVHDPRAIELPPLDDRREVDDHVVEVARRRHVCACIELSVTKLVTLHLITQVGRYSYYNSMHTDIRSAVAILKHALH